MVKVSIASNVGTNTWGGQFPDQTTANSWIAQGQTANWWGKPVRTLTADESGNVVDVDGSTPNLSLATSTNTATDTNGVTVNTYNMPADYTITLTDISAQILTEQMIQKGLQAQQIGATCMAQVYAINEAKLAAGTITTANFEAILADTTLQQIERMLWNGSLASALAMLNTYTSPYYTFSDIATVTAIITNSGLI